MKYIMSLALHDFFQIMIKIMLAFENPAIFSLSKLFKKGNTKQVQIIYLFIINIARISPLI